MHSIPNTDLGLSSFRADLHCHSTCSDGSLDPCALIDLALQVGLQGLVITDHDTIDAYQTAAAYAREKKLLLGTGVEFSCEFKKQSIHVLGYDFSLEHAPFLTYCKRQQEKRMHRNRAILRKLQMRNMRLEENELLSIHENASTIGRPHIASLMVSKGYVKSVQEAFQLYLGDEKSCFVAGEPFPVAEAIAVIQEAGGKAFLAHPHLYSNDSVTREVLSLPFQGIECHYGKTPIERMKSWVKIAKHKDLLISGGSDFHGDAKPQVLLGSSWVGRDVFFSIFERNLIS